MISIKKYIPVLSLIGLFSIPSYFCSKICKPKVAIIGAGIGGASASHFLTELFDKNIDIDIFESKTVGGRLANIKFDNDEFEAGGSIIHPRNKYMTDFVKLLNLRPRPPSSSRFGIWNGKEFVFEESEWDTVTFIKLLYKYGIQPYYLHRYVSGILNDFEKIYELQDKGFTYENVTALIAAMNPEFMHLLNTSVKEHLTSLGYGSKLINELVEATIVVNYGQDTTVQAFVASVSIAGAGFDLWSVEGGNKEVPENLIYMNDKVSLIHATVKKIERLSSDNATKYEVFYKQRGDQNLTSSIYDIVIIAAPMTNDQETPIIFDGFENSNVQFYGKYQTTVATFVVGKVNFSYFGLEDKLGGIMSCDPIVTKINSIGQLSTVNGKSDNNKQVWKVFSRQKLDDSLLNQIFLQVDEVKEIHWKAYPQYSSTMRLDKFKLDSAMYYVNAIEWAASAMEMSAIGGRNVAILAYNNYRKHCSLPTKNKVSINKEDLHSKEL